jgi:small-conductance mechanosensitive channel
MQEIWDMLNANPIVGKILTAIVGVILISIIIRILQQFITKAIRHDDARYSVRKGLAYASYLLVLIFVLSVFSDQLGSLAVAFGVAGAGIAFALQEVIVSIAGWIALSFGQFYHVGDRVQVGGIKGDVIDIGILRTTLMEIGQWVDGDLYNGRIVKVANSFVFKEPVFNYSADFPFIWDELIVPIKYGSDYTLAREIITTAAIQNVQQYSESAQKTWKDLIRKYSIEEASVDPIVTVVSNDNWMAFTARYVVNYNKRRTTKDRIFSDIVSGIEQTDGQVGIASATFHLVEAPRLNINLSREAEK